MVTKAEVRALALARLGPGTGDLVWDVGCGSGSVAIECARLGAAAIGIDKDPEAIALTQRNAAAHGVPVQVVEGAAPGALAALPDPGCAPSSAAAAPASTRSSTSAARARRRAVVVTLAIVERAGPALERLHAAGLEAEATMVQASRLRPARRRAPARGREPGGRGVGGAAMSESCSRASSSAPAAAAAVRPRSCSTSSAPCSTRPARRRRRAAPSPPSTAARDEPGMVAAARHHGWPLVTHPATTLRHVAVPTPSDVVDAHVGTPSVAEAAALLSAGGPLLVPKRRSARATCALAEAS